MGVVYYLYTDYLRLYSEIQDAVIGESTLSSPGQDFVIGAAEVFCSLLSALHFLQAHPKSLFKPTIYLWLSNAEPLGRTGGLHQVVILVERGRHVTVELSSDQPGPVMLPVITPHSLGHLYALYLHLVRDYSNKWFIKHEIRMYTTKSKRIKQSAIQKQYSVFTFVLLLTCCIDGCITSTCYISLWGLHVQKL